MPSMFADQAVALLAKAPTALCPTLELVSIASNQTGELPGSSSLSRLPGKSAATTTPSVIESWSAPLAVVSGPAAANLVQLNTLCARNDTLNAASSTMASTPVSAAVSPVDKAMDTTLGSAAEPRVLHAGLVFPELTLSSGAPIAQPVVDPLSAPLAPPTMQANAANYELAGAVQASVPCGPMVTATLETPANPIETHGLSIQTTPAIVEALLIQSPLVSEMKLIEQVAAEASSPTPPTPLLAVSESVDDALPSTRAVSAAPLDLEAAEEITPAPIAASALEPNTLGPTLSILGCPSENASESDSSEAELRVPGQVSNVVAGIRVCVDVGLFSSNASKPWLDEGLTGKVCKCDEIGDALVDFDGMKAKQWIGKSQFHHLLVYAD